MPGSLEKKRERGSILALAEIKISSGPVLVSIRAVEGFRVRELPVKVIVHKIFLDLERVLDLGFHPGANTVDSRAVLH